MKENQVPAGMPGPGSPQFCWHPPGGASREAFRRQRRNQPCWHPIWVPAGLRCHARIRKPGPGIFELCAGLVLIAPRLSFVARPFCPSSLPAAFRQKRRDLEAAALDLPTSRRIGFDGAALVFC